MPSLSFPSEPVSAQKMFPPFTPTSYFRIFRDKVTGFAISMIRTLQSFLIAGPNIDITINVESTNYPAFYALKKGGVLGSFTVLSCLQKLKGLEIDSSLLTGSLSETESQTNLIAIPIILKGFFRNHIVTIFVDKISHQIEFYDPKGLTVQDQARRGLLFPSEKLQTLKDHVTAIWQNFATDSSWTFKENTACHQSDSFNCGVYVSNFITRRLKGESFETIRQHGLSFHDACSSFREELAITLQSGG